MQTTQNEILRLRGEETEDRTAGVHFGFKLYPVCFYPDVLHSHMQTKCSTVQTFFISQFLDYYSY